MEIQEKLKMGKNYRMIEKFDPSRPHLGIEFDTTYIGRMDCIKGVYYCFTHKGQEAHVHHCYFPSRDIFEDNIYGNVVTITAIKDGSFEINGNKIITSPKELPLIISFDDSLSSSSLSQKMCKTLLDILDEEEVLKQ